MRSVLRLTRRNLASNRLRVGLTTFAVLLGVSFVVSSFVLTDGLLRTFNNIVEDANAEIDIEVNAQTDFDEVEFLARPFDESALEIVSSVDGVEEAAAGMESVRIVPVKANGDPVSTSGAPVLSFSWSDSRFSPLTLVEGDAPTAPGEFAVDTSSADREDLVVGQTYDMIGVGGREPFTLVGTTRFGEENALAGAVLVSFPMQEIQRLDGSDGLITWIDVAVEDDAERDAVLGRINSALPATLQAVTGEEVVESDKDEFTSIVNIFGNVLLAFGLVAVFVSTFIISNTFNILLGQRVRQLALLRALGASSAQVRVSAILEALIIGVLASILGLGGGLLLALGLRGVMNSLGFAMPSIDLILTGRTIVAALVVGVGVTLAASLSPARRAATVPPVAAMRVGFRFGSGEGTRRTIIAIVLAVLGLSAIAYGLFGDPSGPLLLVLFGGGSVLVFVSVAMFAPLFSSPSASFLGAPLEHVPGGGITGHIARENAARNNKRTASTAAGLMIGMALIAMASVTAASLKESFKAALGSTLTADQLVTAPNDGPMTQEVAGAVSALPEFDEVTAVRYGSVRIADDQKDVTAVDVTQLTALLDVDLVAGDPAAAAGEDAIVISQDVADDLGVAIGDPVTVEFAAAGTRPLFVRAIYANEFLIGHYVIDLETWDAFFDSDSDNAVVAKAAEGVDPSAAAAALGPLEGTFPQLQFETQDEWQNRLEGQLDSLLVIINVFLGLAILIALLGIANTMALSVLERTREIGLMRAIGMTRGQTRRMIRLEAGVVSLFGALLGVVVGLVFGWMAVTAIPESIIDRLAIPFGTLIIYVLIATIAGLLAASFPARRAARLNVLDAISYE
jgi:putative ABC transport system permease protein